MAPNKHSTTFAFFSLLLSVASATSHENAPEEKSKWWGFSYLAGSPTGPERWGELREEWSLCMVGQEQSPVDFGNPRPMPDLLPLRSQYESGHVTLKNRGYDMRVEWSDGGGVIWIQGIKYRLRQLHWHAPSEHTIRGFRYPLEMHMVHINEANNEIAVVAILYNIADGSPDPFISKLERHIECISNNVGQEVNVGWPISPYDAVSTGKSYVRYNGSLTTPPCSQGVLWTVKTQPQTASWEQVKLLTDAIHDPARMNARPTQPINGRNIVSFDDTTTGAQAM